MQSKFDRPRVRAVLPRGHLIAGQAFDRYSGSGIIVPGGFGKSGFGPKDLLHAFDGHTDCKAAWIAL